MRVSIFVCLALSAPLVLFACSGTEFTTAPVDDDAGGDADDTATDGAPDTADTADAAEGGGPDAADGADAPEEVDADSSAPADSGDAEAPCTKNECGGCTTLVGKVGDVCKGCASKLECDRTDALKCDTPAPLKACGV